MKTGLGRTSAPAWRPCTLNGQKSRDMVRAEGLEPPRLASLEPKSSASTSSATPAHSRGSPGRPGPPEGRPYNRGIGGKLGLYPSGFSYQATSQNLPNLRPTSL